MAAATSFQPLLPEERVSGALIELASGLVTSAHHLLGKAAPPVRLALRGWLRAMNSYYTNKIEGQHTFPAAIERALQQDFDADAAMQRKQRLAVAHIEAEEALEEEWHHPSPEALFSPQGVRTIHAALYSRLPASDRVTEDGKVVEPGEWRRDDVTAGRHPAPPHADVPELMHAWEQHYRQLRGSEQLIVGMACAHHRLTWVHPFIDGNGRAARLHSHLVLHALGLTEGLWSPMRGLARTHEQYYARLSNADQRRRNDLDGRGALSQEELVAFAHYFLDVCQDQVAFMSSSLELGQFRERLLDLLRYLASRPWQIGVEKSVVKPEVLPAVHYVALTGPVERTAFLAMMGLPPRTARRVLASLLDYGLLRSETRVGPVTLGIPLKSLRWLFPRLWPEADEGASP